MGWNSYDLITQFAKDLSESGNTAFRANILDYLNEIQNDWASRFSWPHLRRRGKKYLAISTDEHNLFMDAPGAPTATIASGGSLVEDSVYKVLITFYESISKAESRAGTASTAVTATAANNTINLTAVPISDESLVTHRNIYLKKDDGNYYYYGTISDNTTLTATITADVDSTREAPDYSFIQKIDGSPWVESGAANYLEYKALDQLRFMFRGAWGEGTPECWGSVDEDRIAIYPKLSSSLELNFYYFQNPPNLFDSTDSQPSMPSNLKEILKAGIIWKGYEYKDRDGQDGKFSKYDGLLKDYISRAGRVIKTSSQVRDVMGSNDGWILN